MGLGLSSHRDTAYFGYHSFGWIGGNVRSAIAGYVSTRNGYRHGSSSFTLVLCQLWSGYFFRFFAVCHRCCGDRPKSSFSAEISFDFRCGYQCDRLSLEILSLGTTVELRCKASFNGESDRNYFTYPMDCSYYLWMSNCLRLAIIYHETYPAMFPISSHGCLVANSS